MTVDPEIPVPPVLYGGAERIAYGLLEQYAQMGHEVVLLANSLSTAPGAHIRIGWKGKSSNSKIDIFRNSWQLYRVYSKYRPDIIHSFSRLLYTYPLLLFCRKARIVQRYGRFISPVSTGIASRVGGKKLHFAAAAAHMLSHLPDTSKWRVFHNFTNTEFFKPTESASLDYLVFLGRIEPIKGPEDAIKAALASGNKLILAGNVPPEHEGYYNSVIVPYLSNPLISHIGPVNDISKVKLLQHAKALLFPINLKVEAFGIVMVESLTCGTPVIAYDIAAVPEVIIDSVNGYRVKNLEEMIKKIGEIDSISRKRVREDALLRFSSAVIAKKYLDYFKELAK